MSIEIYCKSVEGTKDDPIVANQMAGFSADINGVDASRANSSFEWRSSPQLQAFGSDIHRASFKLPDWRINGTLTVRLKLMGSPLAGDYEKTFHVRPMTEEEKANRIIPTRSIYFPGNEEYRVEVEVFEEAERLGYLKRKGLWFPKWRYEGTVDEFLILMGLDVDDPPEPNPEPPEDPEIIDEDIPPLTLDYCSVRAVLKEGEKPTIIKLHKEDLHNC